MLRKYWYICATFCDMKNNDSKGWLLPLLGLTLSTFIFNTSEFIPIGLLTDIARDFSLNEAGAGMLISVYAWVVMILSLPLMIWASKINPRTLLLALVALFSCFQVMSYCSVSYSMLMSSRIGVACTHAIFWSIISPLAVKIVPPEKKAFAVSMVVSGSSIAMILGMPIGRVIGLQIGWRMTFLSIGAFSFLTFLYLFFALPKIPSTGKFSLKALPSLLSNRALMGLYLFVLLFSGSYYVCYSYIEPFLKQVSLLPDSLVTNILILFGLAGITGSVLFSKYYTKNKYLFTTVVMVNFALCMMLIYPLSGSMWTVLVVCVFWGVTSTTFNAAMQNEVMTLSDENSSAVAMSISSGIFNMGIGGGSYIGGLVCTHSSIAYIGYTAAVGAVAALLYWLLRLKGLYKKSAIDRC